MLAHMLEKDMEPYTQILFHDVAFQDALNLKIYKFSAEHLSEAEKDFYGRRVTLNEAQAVAILAETRSQSNTKWDRERKVSITGSKCHEYFTFVPKDNRSWEEKVSSMMADTFRGNEATRYGKESEAEAIATYESLMNNNVTQVGLCVHPSLPWLGYSPDGVIFKEGTPAILLEKKVPFLANKRRPQHWQQIKSSNT